MNVFDYFFEGHQTDDKNFVLGTQDPISYKELYGQSLKFASYLSTNFGENNNIILIGQNSTFFIIAYLGILKSGNVCVPLNFAIEKDNFDYIAKLTDCKTFILANKIQSLLPVEPSFTVINETVLKDILAQESTSFPYSNFDASRLGEIIFTSGSTGEPKGVMISHRNIISNTNSIIAYLHLTSNDTMGVVLPFFYCYGLSLLHTHLRVGASIVLLNNFIFLGAIIKGLNDYKCTGFAGVPSHFQILLKKSQTFKTTEFPNLRYVTQAGGKLHKVFIEEFIEAFPQIKFHVMYGQTEATARLSHLDPNELKAHISSIGKAIPGVELKVIDKRGKIAAINKAGELIAKGDNIMMGYYKDPQGTSKVLKNGWLYTGDIVKMDINGFIHLVARKKEILKIGGKRVSPKEIEDVIITIPEVVDCTITSIYDALLGEAIKATVVLKNDIDEAEMTSIILRYCAKKLSAYKIPQQIVFQKTITTNATGKKTSNK